jgi:hypothetical protein
MPNFELNRYHDRFDKFSHFYIMKFINVYCENRKANVYVSLDKIVLVSAHEQGSLIELQGSDPVRVNMEAQELIRKINGENKTSIGFRTTGN